MRRCAAQEHALWEKRVSVAPEVVAARDELHELQARLRQLSAQLHGEVADRAAGRVRDFEGRVDAVVDAYPPVTPARA